MFFYTFPKTREVLKVLLPQYIGQIDDVCVFEVPSLGVQNMKIAPELRHFYVLFDSDTMPRHP